MGCNKNFACLKAPGRAASDTGRIADTDDAIHAAQQLGRAAQEGGADEPSCLAFSLPHALQSCWGAQLAGLDADALHMALEVGMFAHLDDVIGAPQLAERLAWEPLNTGHFLELLWSMEILERGLGADGVPVYRTQAALRPYLHPGSERYCGDALLFRHRTLRQAGAWLGSLVREGAPDSQAPDPEALQSRWAQAARLQIAQEQRAITVEVAGAILSRQPEFAQMRRMLDLGGGPGLVAIALAGLRPELSGVVFEYPAVAEVARENIERARLSGRLQARGGDLATDELGDDYDLIWCSSVLHFVSDIPATLARLHAALRPGGLLVCCHAEIGTDACRARPVLQYYLHMRMQGRQVLPGGQLATLLRKAGFASVEQMDEVRFPMAPVTVLIARKGRCLS